MCHNALMTSFFWAKSCEERASVHTLKSKVRVRIKLSDMIFNLLFQGGLTTVKQSIYSMYSTKMT